MPLRDHFHSPLDDETSWDGFHGQWPAMIVLDLAKKLPPQYVALPRVHPRSFVEVDIGTFEKDDPGSTNWGSTNDGGLATATWAPTEPTITIATDLPDQDEYEVRVYDMARGRRLVAAIEIVSPANKDRPEHRRAFVAKCAALLQQQVSVTIIDLVTTRHFNLFTDLLEMIGKDAPSQEPAAPEIYAVACRGKMNGTGWRFESWLHRLTIGQPLPILPLWLSETLAIPLELEPCYEDTCRVLRIT